MLLVDDNPEILDLYSTLLRRHGFSVSTASGARHALAVLKRCGRFDHIVSDFEMPSMNGLEFLRKATHLRPGPSRTLLTAQEPSPKRLRSAKTLGVRVILKSAALDCLLGRGPFARSSRT